jgi:hypothetical protein
MADLVGFKDSIPLVRCKVHTSEYVTNYDCFQLKPICPECLDAHLKENQRNGIPPEVDTLKKVRNMCSQKATSLADSLDREIGKIGFALNVSPSSLLSKYQSDLDQIRKQLHKFVDDYLDSVRNDLFKKLRGNQGDQSNLYELLQEVKQMSIQLRNAARSLFSKWNFISGQNILNAVAAIVKIDPESYMRTLQSKLGDLQREQNSIDLTLDPIEMQDLLSVLQRIVKVDSKTVSNQNQLDRLRANINPNIDQITAHYFQRKFYSVENPTNFDQAQAVVNQKAKHISLLEPTSCKSG